MSKQPIPDKPEIAAPSPDPKPQPVKPEIPPNKDTPEKQAPVKARLGTAATEATQEL
jgi:hypothetical protein